MIKNKMIIYILIIQFLMLLILILFFLKIKEEKWIDLELYWDKNGKNKILKLERGSDTMEVLGGSNVIINDDDYFDLIIYFSNDTEQIQSETLLFSSSKKNSLKFFQNVEEFYKTIKYNDKNKFLYGKIKVSNLLVDIIELEIYYIDNDKNLLTKRIYKMFPNDEFRNEIKQILDIINSSKIEGYYNIGRYTSSVTIFTRKKKIHKNYVMLDENEKKLLEKMIKLFKEEIPKEYFGIRDTTDKTDF